MNIIQIFCYVLYFLVSICDQMLRYIFVLNVDFIYDFFLQKYTVGQTDYSIMLKKK